MFEDNLIPYLRDRKNRNELTFRDIMELAERTGITHIRVNGREMCSEWEGFSGDTLFIFKDENHQYLHHHEDGNEPQAKIPLKNKVKMFEMPCVVVRDSDDKDCYLTFLKTTPVDLDAEIGS